MKRKLDEIVEAVQRLMRGEQSPWTISLVLQQQGTFQITGLYTDDDRIAGNIGLAETILQTRALADHHGYEKLVSDTCRYLDENPIPETSAEQLYYELVRGIKAMNELGLDEPMTRRMLVIAANAFYAVEKKRVAANPLIN